MHKKYNSIIVRYGEISLKGRNRYVFENQLKNNIINFLKFKKIKFKEVILLRGRIYIRGINEVPLLKNVFGIYSYSPALEIEKDFELLKKKTYEFINDIKKYSTFRVSCQRIDKNFHKNSIEIERLIGEIIFENSNLKVDLKNYDLNFNIEIGEKSIYIFFEKIKAYGGMPFSSSGKLVSLISSGIDSPVSTFLMMKRGIEPILLHYKITDQDFEKVLEIKDKLEEFTSGKKLELISIDRNDIFKNQFSKLYNSKKYHSYICLLCKYLMHKTAGEIARQKNALGIITGDNLAQVATQTLKNLYAYRDASKMPVYSPLISFDKEDTIKIAKEIGIYDISIKKAKACVPPKNPKTGVDKDIFENLLKELNL